MYIYRNRAIRCYTEELNWFKNKYLFVSGLKSVCNEQVKRQDKYFGQGGLSVLIQHLE